MKRKLLHMLLGVATSIGCFSQVMAAERGIIVNDTYVYSVPEANVQALYSVYEGESFEVINEVNGYYELNVDGQSVYVTKDQITFEEVTEAQEDANKVNQSSNGEQVVAFAKQYIGTPYVSGGNNLNSGVDCSGFTQQVYKNFGVKLERSSGSQYACNGYSVSKDVLLPGDLVFYGYGSVCHVAIYVGSNQVIHAPVPGQSVCIVPLWQRGDAPIIGYKRIF